MLHFLTNIFDSSTRELKKLRFVVDQINALEPSIQRLTDRQLKEKTDEFRARLQKGETLDQLLPEAFAVVREAAKRTLGQRHYDVQLMGGIVLHQGKVAEMKTGEGKTLVATLPLYLNALTGKGVHLVTVNDFLAKRDTQWMGPIYDFLGLSVGCIGHERSYLFERREKEIRFGEEFNLRQCSRKEAYQADITYGQNNEFGFDYLRDNMVYRLEDVAQRAHYYAIVDEVDSILIDEARTPLIISAPAEESARLYQTFARIVPQLQEGVDFNVDEKIKAVALTDSGISKVEKALGLKNLYTEGGVGLVHHLENALKAHVLYRRDRDYVIKDGEVIIVDEFTGRLLHGRRYSEGLHQAIEAKEGVEIKRESDTLATITFQNYFRMYEKLAGMTGTAATEAEEFYTIYHLDVVVIPTHRPMIRKDLPDKIYKTEEAKFQAVAEEIKERYQKGQPVLVGTISIEKNEYLSALLHRAGVPHEVLNAKNHEKEAKIIAQAGKKKAVTVATNMAGRGVDIILGGTPPADPKEQKGWQKEHEEVVKLGGLHVIGTERHEARRIDNQLRGRAGRQGDPGSSQFYVSLEDDLMHIFGGERIKKMMEIMKFPKDMPIEHRLLSKSIEQAQKRVEGHNFDIRKHLLEYDDAMNKQRELVYRKRREILANKSLKDEIWEIIKGEIQKIWLIHVATESQKIFENISSMLPEFCQNEVAKLAQREPDDSVLEELLKLAQKAYEEKEQQLGPEIFQEAERVVYLRTIDTLWVLHLNAMEELREGIGLRGWGQRDPLVEYKYEAHHLFQRYLAAVKEQISKMIYKIEVEVPMVSEFAQRRLSEKGAEEALAAGAFLDYHRQPRAQGSIEPSPSSGSFESRNERKGTPVVHKTKIGRNDPCPCGKINPKTGKPMKYKKCCYPKYE